ncbi:MAG: acyl-protein synthetase [Candidatus Riflebacteria bacterium]|nr:acyl-protein synthetase [Candidatus Riflebacteria bacterium]
MAEGKPFEACGRLFATSQAFGHSPATDRLFDEAMGEALRWHQQRCPEFRGFLARHGFTGKRLPVTPEEIPPLFVTIFKEHRLVSIPDERIRIELTSSGTGGQRSAIVLDHRSYRRILQIVDHIFDSLGLMARDEAVNYLCFTYDPRVAKNVGTAFSDKILTGLTRRRRVFYAIRWDEAKGEFAFDLAATVARLQRFARRPDPVRILGFPAHLWQVCDALERAGVRLQLGPRSFIITGGGWKVHKDQEVTKDVFRERVCRVLGLPRENLRDTFGMVEHGIPYVDCERGRLHVPIYARVRVVDPETLAPLPVGSRGLLHLMTPYLSSYPSISLLSTDLAVVEPGCPCGRPGDTIRILGRAGLAKHKGCAITALELLT